MSKILESGKLAPEEFFKEGNMPRENWIVGDAEKEMLGYRDFSAILKRLSYEDKAEIVTKEMAKIMPSLGMEKSPENKMYFKKEIRLYTALVLKPCLDTNILKL